MGTVICHPLEPGVSLRDGTARVLTDLPGQCQNCLSTCLPILIVGHHGDRYRRHRSSNIPSSDSAYALALNEPKTDIDGQPKNGKTEEADIPLLQRSNNYREDNNCSVQARTAINEVSILSQPYNNQHSTVTPNPISEVQSIETKKNSTIYHFEYGKKQYYTTVMTTTTESKHTMPIIPTDTTTTTCVLISPMSTPSTICDIETLDLATETLPAVDTAAACDKAAVRLRYLLRLLQSGEISAEVLQKNLHYAARVLEAVLIDETKTVRHSRVNCTVTNNNDKNHTSSQGQNVENVENKRLADEDDELSAVQPDAVPAEVREWLASTFTRQLATTRKRSNEKPKFRSVANAIRAGIFVDRIYRRVASTAMMQFPPEVAKILKTLDDWSFDVFALAEAANGQPVKYLGYDLLNRYGIIHKFKIAPTTLATFLSRIEEGYCRYHNPYHNNLHAADVTQTTHHILCQTGLMNWLTDLEIYATLLAALIHDYEHTGTTNNFHVMSGSETAMLYNDRAVLENHHISAAFRVLKEDDANILVNLSRDEYRELRTLIIDMVLSTDMSFHFQQLKNMKSLLTLDPGAIIDKSKALSLVLHCCDISHPAKKWALHHRWTMLLLEEFFRQGDLERELGLPFSPLCDRNNTLVAESQIGFIDFIVDPSMTVCSDMLEHILAPTPKPANNVTRNSASGGSNRLPNNKSTGTNNANETIPEGEESETNGETTSGETTFKILKPWHTTLAENKKIWKEQAVRDAELRLLAESNPETTESSKAATKPAGKTE